MRKIILENWYSIHMHDKTAKIVVDRLLEQGGVAFYYEPWADGETVIHVRDDASQLLVDIRDAVICPIDITIFK